MSVSRVGLVLCFIAACDSRSSVVAGRIGTETFLADLGTRPPTSKPIDWPDYGGDAGQTRASAVTEINRATVVRLRRAWTWWRINVRHSSERPQYNPVCSSADLSACQRMTEFVKRHNQEKRQILQDVPGD